MDNEISPPANAAWMESSPEATGRFDLTGCNLSFMSKTSFRM